MITLDRFEEILDELACELPEEFYGELHGGVQISESAKRHPLSVGDDLYIMGEYRVEHGLGRYIVIYYGSFSRQFGHLSEEEIKSELRRTLRHEFRHHLESLGGERGLEYEDEEDLEDYLWEKGFFDD